MIWKQIDSKYSISEYGDVRNDKRGNILKPDYNCKGYKRVVLSGSKKHHFIHRLVASAYIPNIHNKPQVNHLDMNKLNNHYSNLEWCTNAENTIHAFTNGNSNKCVISEEQYRLILQYTSNGLKPKNIVTLTGLNINTIIAIRQGFNNKRFVKEPTHSHPHI